MYQPPSSHVECVPVIEFGEELFSFQSLEIVQQPSIEDTTFHFRTKGQLGAPNCVFNHPSDDTVPAEFVPNDPFWKTYLSQSISELLKLLLSLIIAPKVMEGGPRGNNRTTLGKVDGISVYRERSLTNT